MSRGPVSVRLVGDVAAFRVGMLRARLMALVSFWLARRRARDQWVSSHMLTASPSPWAAPTRTEARR
jgi:hypothetical protein